MLRRTERVAFFFLLICISCCGLCVYIYFVRTAPRRHCSRDFRGMNFFLSLPRAGVRVYFAAQSLRWHFRFISFRHFRTALEQNYRRFIVEFHKNNTRFTLEFVCLSRWRTRLSYRTEFEMFFEDIVHQDFIIIREFNDCSSNKTMSNRGGAWILCFKNVGGW